MHDARHTVATSLLNQGCSLDVLQKVLGHGVVDQIRRWMAVPQPVDTTQFTGWRTGIPSPISLFITFTPARISPTWAL